MRIWICSVASCSKSRSPEMTETCIPRCSARWEMVPRISSASYPGSSTTVTPMERSISFIKGTCWRSSSAIGLRVPLYPSYILWRKVGSWTSNATVRYCGFSSSRILNKIFRKPYTALVCSPSELVKSGSPKNALFKILCPSINTNFSAIKIPLSFLLL